MKAALNLLTLRRNEWIAAQWSRLKFCQTHKVPASAESKIDEWFSAKSLRSFASAAVNNWG
jgi:hypothetical protein